MICSARSANLERLRSHLAVNELRTQRQERWKSRTLILNVWVIDTTLLKFNQFGLYIIFYTCSRLLSVWAWNINYLLESLGFLLRRAWNWTPYSGQRGEHFSPPCSGHRERVYMRTDRSTTECLDWTYLLKFGCFWVRKTRAMCSVN